MTLIPCTLVEIKGSSQYGKNQLANGFKRNSKSKNQQNLCINIEFFSLNFCYRV